MGFFDMFKKKPAESTISIDSGMDALNSDLPSIDGSNLPDSLALPPIDDTGLPQLDLPELPQFNLPVSDAPSTKLPSINSLDDTGLPPLPSMPGQFETQNNQQNNNAKKSTQKFSEITPEDINNLFLADENWHEPDWANYNPYLEEPIETPQTKDFIDITKMKLPSLGDESQPAKEDEVLDEEGQNFFAKAPMKKLFIPDENKTTLKEIHEEYEEEFDSVEKTASPLRKHTPIELFVKGADYKKVFEEMNAINDALSKGQSKISFAEELDKQREPLLSAAKEDMEFIQKKLMFIDKKIFT